MNYLRANKLLQTLRRSTCNNRSSLAETHVNDIVIDKIFIVIVVLKSSSSSSSSSALSSSSVLFQATWPIEHKRKKIDRQKRTHIKHTHTNTHTNIGKRKEKRIVEFSMQRYSTASSTSVHVNAKLHDSYMKSTNT